MCLNPLTIRNPTKVIHTGGGHLLQMQVPCGVCAQCLQAKRNEWYVRTYYEMQRTFSLNGYVLFDTLTYDDEHLPMISNYIDIKKYGIKDFSCFDHKHFKLFLKRLRRRISHKYKIKKNAFRYFLTTEYGEDDRYTHRPHHHILFFVYVKIDPLEFSQLIAECWQYGRTDGYPFKPASYVYSHTYGYSYCGNDNKDFNTITSVAMYVSKYITKSSKFTKTLRSRLAYVREQVTKYNSLHKRTIDDENLEMLKELKRNVDMFHRQSQGFGLSYLDNLTPERLMFIDCDKITMKDKDKIVKTYPLPMYYKRKLFYTLKKHDDGSTYWELSDEGLKHTLNVKLQSIDRLTLKLMDIIRNCTDDALVDLFFKYLGDRDISDYIIYQQFYKGRHRHINGVNYKLQQQNPLTDEEENLNDWLLCLSSSYRPYSNLCDTIQVGETLVRTPILKKEELAELEYDLLKCGHSIDLLNNSHSDLVNTYIQRYCFNEQTDPSFNHFDKISVLVVMMTEKQRTDQQVTFDYLEDLKERYKHLKLF